MFELLEKMYVEMQKGFNRLDGRIDGVESRFDGVESRFDGLERRLDKVESRLDGVEKRLDKLEINQEHANSRIDEMYEALTSHIEVNERQHQEIMEQLRGEINVVELAVKRLAK